MKKFLLLFASLVLLVTACSKEERNSSDGKDTGKVQLSLSSAGTFKSDDKVNVGDFKVVIKGASGAVEASYEKYSQMPSLIELSAGNYTIEAGNVTTREAEFGAPEYFKSESFEVEAGKVSNVSLVCTLSNVKLTVQCGESFFKEFGDKFSITATNGKGNLEFDKSIIDAGTSGYFKVSESGLKIYMTGYRLSDQSEVTHTYEIPVIKAQDHHIVKFNAVATGAAEIGSNGISIDYTVVDRDHTITIPGEDETPVDPVDPVDPVEEYLPTIVIDGDKYDIDSPIVVVGMDESKYPSDVNVTIKTLNGKTIENLFVTMESPALTDDLLAIVKLKKSFDMANPTEELKEGLAMVGLLAANDNVKGKNEQPFPIGTFIPILLQLDSFDDNTTSITHRFIVKVVDSEGKYTEKTLTIQHKAE